MFTLKLYRRCPHLITKIISCLSIETIHIGSETDEVRVYQTQHADGGNYHSFYVGKREPQMTAIDDDNHWGWALVENWEGNTSQHIRPYNYG